MARSLIKSEYRALANANTELLWLQSLLQELGVLVGDAPILWCNNLSAIYLTANLIFYT